MEVLFIIGRILYGGFFLMSGANHFMKTESMTEYAKLKKVNNPRNAVLISGLLAVLGGLGILLGVAVRWAIVFLVVFLVAVSYKMHAFWTMKDGQEKEMEKTNFMKNMALLGAALMFLALGTSWPMAL